MTTKYRVWHIPQIPMDPFYREVVDLDIAKIVVDTLADYDLFQFENKVKPDYSNASGIEWWDEELEEWVEVDGWDEDDE